ncbi:MAG: DUF2911 domain-containing protein [Cyclobacteriaceae bacterium]|nr:DUF2911 domain-containing protein [Cyclobacteriaceae bacterium]
MNKLLKKGLITVVFLGVLGYAAFRIVINETKKNSPQDIAAFVDDDLEIQVVYCQPLKKGRTVFGTESEGALQPYGQYWRLGANEATTVETNQTLIIEGNELEKGIYSIYAIPGRETWKIGFNKEADRWGAGEPNYEKDLFVVEVPVYYTKETTEQFNINITKEGIVFKWDTSKVILPFTVTE